MIWYKEWANSDAHPKMVAAGFWGAAAFRCLCRTSAEFDLDGRIPPQYASPVYLSRRLQLDAEDDPLDPATECNGPQRMQRGIDAAVASGLLRRDGDFLVIDGWGERQSISSGVGMTNTERSQRFRDRQKSENSPRNEMQRANVARNGRGEERRVEKKREEKKVGAKVGGGSKQTTPSPLLQKLEATRSEVYADSAGNAVSAKQREELDAFRAEHGEAAVLDAFAAFMADSYWAGKSHPIGAFASQWQMFHGRQAPKPERKCKKLTDEELAHLYDENPASKVSA